MASLIQRIDDIFDYAAHPMTLPYLPGAPWYLMTSAFIYMVGVVLLGPRLMKNRSAFDLKGLIRIYNLVNIVLNTGWFVLAMYFSRFTFDCWLCRPKYIPEELVILAGFLYMSLKVFDLLDTVFFVLRKKNNQVSL